MSIKGFLYDYGEKVVGYDITVINEREARAAAGILCMVGTIVIFLGIGFNHIIVARAYLTFLWLDFTIRMFTPKYAPSLLLGKFMVQNQKPEYVGGVQKRFAWTIGWLISLPMVYWFVLNWDINFYKVLVCVLCATLMFLESAFSICAGCILYKALARQNAQYCPGGVCEIHTKEPIQTFNVVQKIIAIVTMIGFSTGLYLFLAYEEPKTFFGEFLHEAVLTQAQLQKEKDDEFEREAAKEFEDF